MNPITQQNLICHELIGLEVIVIHSSHPGYLGIRGKVIDETKGTILISNGVKRKSVPKSVAMFRFTLPDKSIVEIDGREIVGRPVERIKKLVRRRL